MENFTFRVQFGVFKLFLLITELFYRAYCTMVDFNSPFQNRQDFIWGDALNIMSYHRSKMNEYLCKNYLASEIIEKYQNISAGDIESREGKPFNRQRLARDSLLRDPGSEKYKDWLSKSSTLEDIYRQFEKPETGSHKNHYEEEDEHEGEISGYALLEHKHVHPKPFEYGTIDNHHLGSHVEIYSHDYHEEEEDEHEDKGMKLKDLFHFALTAIAFMAFATFMIEVIMCLMETPQTTEPDYILVPTTTGNTGPGSKVEAEETITYRQERLLNLDPMSLDTLNEISKKVLMSIEGFALMYEDNGECLRRALCKSSRYTNTLKGTQKVWLPIWSLGASWVAGRLSRNKNLDAGTLDYLKATVFGLVNKDCNKLYPKCDEKLRRKRNT